MSLKAFHLVFVTVTTLLFVFMAAWSFALSSDSSAAVIALGIVGCIGALAMPAYGALFYRKVTRIHL
jgi:hypothetical protein